ncbi:MAG TPA: NHL repeat-containing protein [Prolixibacteraceae bacterium]|nr:NHL repeat-containing protein [Prolixibacteraceae bacterium]HPS13873.1 NHL repeat-containing protein [Prolixibacteraceae bacterium]
MKPCFALFATVVLLSAIAACTPQHATVTLVAGNPNDTTTLYQPFGMCCDGKGNLLVADAGRNSILIIKPNGEATILAGTEKEGNQDGDQKTASFCSPSGVCCDKAGNIYVAGFGGQNIRKISPDGTVTTVAGTGEEGYVDGPANIARFSSPRGICIDSNGNLFVGDCWNHRIRKITPEGMVSTFAGGGKTGELVVNDWRDGADTTARFDAPCGMAIDQNNNLYVADANNSCIRKITPKGFVSTIAGKGKEKGLTDGAMGISRLNVPTELTVANDLTIYFSDTYNHCIRKIDNKGVVTTLAGTGQKGYAGAEPLNSQLSSPRGICIYKGNLYFAEWGNHVIRKIGIEK